ncbi:MAG: IS3 family transposase [Candidatus Thiodiazotropha sp. (ex Lucinoma borealis)]|nr:IS3 family transposase [Candidatus Thiodiazotropha sp. (ex Lucinoma borealis)]
MNQIDRDWLKVSRSGFYDWLTRKESNRAKEDRQLSCKILTLYNESRGTYGSPRIHKALRRKGIRVGEKRVERLMRLLRIQGRVEKVTRKQPGLKRFKEAGANLRLDASEVTGPDQQWVADVTYIKLHGTWFYLAVVMDVYSRRILGWSLGKNRTTELTLAALRYAAKGRNISSVKLFHTDRGIEYTAYRFRDELKKYGCRPSFNRPGRCTDNAHMESFFHTLKAELIRGRYYRNEADLRYSLNSYINRFYNHRRLHSGIGYNTPAEYERNVA